MRRLTLHAVSWCVCRYFFTHRPWWIDARKPWLGVAHTSELPFVFQFSPFLHTPGEVTLGANVCCGSARLRCCWR